MGAVNITPVDLEAMAEAAETETNETPETSQADTAQAE